MNFIYIIYLGIFTLGCYLYQCRRKIPFNRLMNHVNFFHFSQKFCSKYDSLVFFHFHKFLTFLPNFFFPWSFFLLLSFDLFSIFVFKVMLVSNFKVHPLFLNVLFIHNRAMYVHSHMIFTNVELKLNIAVFAFYLALCINEWIWINSCLKNSNCLELNASTSIFKDLFRCFSNLSGNVSVLN